jgi:hypothetical protein
MPHAEDHDSFSCRKSRTSFHGLKMITINRKYFSCRSSRSIYVWRRSDEGSRNQYGCLERKCPPSMHQCPAANSIFIVYLQATSLLGLQMLPFRRLAPVFKCLFSVSRPITSSVHRRAEASSSTTLDTEEPEQFEEREEGDIQDMLSQRASGPASYRQFLEEIGYRYKSASPQQWLGNTVVEFVS